MGNAAFISSLVLLIIVISISSILGPSPDWLVGVSSLELCQKNGTWAREKVIDLYPYDAGVDAGISYEDNDSPMPEAVSYK
jgi:hypothetical protein